MSVTNLELPYSIDPKNPFLVDKRSGPWASVNAANAGIPEAVRVRGLVVIILDAVVGYYYKDGIADNNLVPINTDESAIWGQITGVLSDQTDLQGALNAKENSIAAGTTLQYWRGDKTWQTLDTAAVPENGALYFTNTRARAALTLTTTGNNGAATYVGGVFNIPVYSLAGLGGEPSIAAGTNLQYWRGDKTWQTLNTDAVPEATAKYYTDARVLAFGDTQWARLDGSYTNPSWLVSLPWSKITNTPTTLGGYGITDAFTETEADARFVKKAGDTMSGNLLIAAPASIDSSLVPGEDILNLGTANAAVINIGWSGATINIQGSVMWQDVDNLAVTDKLIRLNKGGATASGVSSGFEIEENAIITGWFATDATRTGWDFKAPASQQLTLGLDLLTASRTIKMPNLTGTLLIDTGTYNDPSWLATLAWSKITGTPTTLSGYGITNAYTKTETDTLLSSYTLMTRQLTINGVTQDLLANRTWNVGTVTSVGLAVPTGFTSGASVSSSGNLTLGFDAGYSLPTNVKQGQWDTAFGWGNWAAGSHYIGTTLIANNRASGAQTLTGVSIDGTAGNANLWNGWNQDYSVALSTAPSGLFGYNSGTATQRIYNATALATFLGLGSYAYRSSGLAELTGATFTGHVSLSNYNLANVGTITFYASGSHPVIDGIRGSYFGYSSTYPTLILGTNSGNTTLAFNVDVVANPSGAYTGNGSEYLWRNVGSFKTPNAANNSYNTLFSWNLYGETTFPNQLNASVVGTLNGHTTASSNIANALAARDGSGDITLRLLRTEWAGGEAASDGYILMQNAIGSGVDNYARPTSKTTLRSYMNLGDNDVTYMRYQGFTLDANTILENRTGFTYASNAPYTGPIVHFNASGYGFQLNATYSGGGLGLAYRTRNGDNSTWNSWRGIWHEGNFTPGNYVPYTGATTNLNMGGWNVSANLFLSDGYYSAGVVPMMIKDATYNRLYRGNGIIGIYLGGSDAANYYDNTTHYIRNSGGGSNYAIFQSGMSTFYGESQTINIDNTNRTTYRDIVYVTAQNGANPYTGHGGGILFRGATYYTSSNVAYARIGTFINSQSANTYGSTLFFDIATDAYGSTARAFELYWTGRTKWFYNSEINGTDRVLELKGPGGGNNSLLRYSDGATAKFSTGFNNDNYIIYDDVAGAYRFMVTSTGVIRVTSGNTFNVENGRSVLAYTSPGWSYTQATTEIYSSGTYGPRLSLHWGGVVASQFGLESSGRIAALNNPGTSYENFIANNIWAATHLYVGGNIVGSGAASFTSSVSASSFAVGEMILNSNQLYRNSSNEMYLNYSGGGNTMLGNSSGNVSINAGTNPLYRLHIGGTLGVTSDAIFLTHGTFGGRTRVGGGYITDIGGTGNHSGIAFGSSGIYPVDGNGSYSSTKDLGYDSLPWRSAYLSGAIRRTNPLGGYLNGGYAGVETTTTPGLIYAISDSYIPTASTLGTMYGVGYTHGSFAGDPMSSGGTWGFYVAAAGTIHHRFGQEAYRTNVPIVNTSSSASSFNGNITAASLSVSSGGTLGLVSGDIWIMSNAGFGILSANASRAIAITNTSIALNYHVNGVSHHLNTNGTVDYVFKAAATNVGSTKYILLAGVTGVSNGFTVTHNGSNMVYHMAGGRLTVEDTVTAPNFADTYGSNNVNLASGGTEGRGLVAGYSGGNYGGIGYNIRHTGTNSSWIAPGGDNVSYLSFNAGFTFMYAPGGAANRDISGTLIRVARIEGVGSFLTRGEFYPGYNNGALGEQSSYYIHGWTTGGGLRTNGDWIVAGEVEASTYYTATDNYYRAVGNGGLYWQTHTTRITSGASSYVQVWSSQGISLLNLVGANKGYLYYDGSGFGLLHSGGGWSVRGNVGTTGGTLYGNWDTTDAFTATDFYANSWFRNNANNTGLYNVANNVHFYSSSTVQWDFATAGSSYIQIALRPGGHNTTVRGYLYADTSNNVGLLGYDGNWALRMDTNKNMIASGGAIFTYDLTTSGGQGRFGGWYTGTSFTGPAAEIGVSSGIAHVLAYNRGTSAYINLRLVGDNVDLVSQSGTINAFKNILFSQVGDGIVGQYNSTLYQGIFAMGMSYTLPAGGSTPGSLYGLAWAHPNAGGQAGYLNTHGLLVMVNGLTYAAISENIWARGNIIANGNMVSNLVTGTTFETYAGTGNGYRFWQSNAYKISMGASALYYYGPVTDYSIKMQMNDGDAGRGFTWGRESYAPVAALNATTGNFQTAGTITAGGNVTAYSDIRVKTNIESIQDPIQKLMMLNGFTYSRTDIDDKFKRFIGLSAQDVIAAGLSEAVETTSNGMYSVAYGNLAAGLLVEVGKNHEQRIAELESKLQAYENKFGKLN